ncbi:MAG: SIS domain-containing protein [Chthonomonadales bacterium]|nr:SIS domain-containing protein [Chthonomonadales bacterium]
MRKPYDREGSARMGYLEGYLADVKRLVDDVPLGGVQRLVDLMADAWQDGRRVLLMGNGGSAATASHIVNDLQKCIHLEAGRPLKTLCLSDCSPLVLAWANDTEYANVYAPQIECWAEPGDLVIGISGSGNSANIVRAIETANRLGAHTFGLAGHEGGRLGETARDCIVVRSENMQQIEDLHMIVLHLAFSALRERLRAAS